MADPSGSFHAHAAALAALDAEEDALEDAAVQRVTAASRRRLPPACAARAAGDDGAAHAHSPLTSASATALKDAVVGGDAWEARDRPALAQTSAAPPRAASSRVKGDTGFCAECDTYLFRVVAQRFGYDMAALLLASAAGVTESAVPAAAAAAAATEAASGGGGAEEPWVELFDPCASRRCYYNAATGESQWEAPATYRALRVQGGAGRGAGG
jgi:hypothetical protein